VSEPILAASGPITDGWDVLTLFVLLGIIGVLVWAVLRG
jgi:hypothetical protein